MADRHFRQQGHLEVVADIATPFVLRAASIPPEKDIMPRQWIYGRHLVRGFVSLLVAPGGTGKSSLILGLCIACATGRKLLGHNVYQQCNTALLNLEDPQDEIDRRLAAIGRFYNVADEDIRGKFFMSPAEQKVLIAAEGEDGFEVVHPDERRIIECVRDNKIGVLGVDPFAESHELEENSNPHMIRAAAAWRRVARFGNCAVLLAHHVRKGTVDSIEAARGAKALTDSARIGLLLSSMSAAEAELLGISEEDRLQYVRLDDAKANLAPRAAAATWYHLNHVKLDNATPEYPHGDDVVVIENWTQPSVWELVSVPHANEALDKIAAGLSDGSRYTHTRRSEDRWAGRVLVDLLGLKDAQASEVIRVWMKNGLLQKESYFDPGQRKNRIGLVVNNALRPGSTTTR